MHISLALDVVCAASEEELKHHSVKTFSAFQKLRQLSIVNSLLPSLERREPTPPHSEHGSTRSSSSNGDDEFWPQENEESQSSVEEEADLLPPVASSSKKPLKRPPKKLLEKPKIKLSLPASLLSKLEEDYSTISAFLDSEVEEAVKSAPTWTRVDHRIQDILIADGSTQPTPEIQFRKTLGLLSLAEEFENWESGTYKSSRVRELAEKKELTKESTGRNGRIKQFVRDRQEFYRDTAERGVRLGIKPLVIQLRSGTTGILAVLAFVSRACRMLKYREIDEMINLFKCSSVFDLAQRKSEWFDACRRRYHDLATAHRLPCEIMGTNRMGLLAEVATAACGINNQQEVANSGDDANADAQFPTNCGKRKHPSSNEHRSLHERSRQRPREDLPTSATVIQSSLPLYREDTGVGSLSRDVRPALEAAASPIAQPSFQPSGAQALEIYDQRLMPSNHSLLLNSDAHPIQRAGNDLGADPAFENVLSESFPLLCPDPAFAQLQSESFSSLGPDPAFEQLFSEGFSFSNRNGPDTSFQHTSLDRTGLDPNFMGMAFNQGVQMSELNFQH